MTNRKLATILFLHLGKAHNPSPNEKRNGLTVWNATNHRSKYAETTGQLLRSIASQPRKMFHAAALSIGIMERIGTHTLRKTNYWAYQFGVNVTRIQKPLNHSTPSITLAYIGITQEELDNVYLTLEL